MENIYLSPEHELLREQIARFVAREVEPHALAWEEAGSTPREVLKKLGHAGLLGLMYEEAYGGGAADALTNLVFAEVLSQSTFGGFIITVLVHTDMASPHLHHAGTPAQKARYLPGVTAGDALSAWPPPPDNVSAVATATLTTTAPPMTAGSARPGEGPPGLPDDPRRKVTRLTVPQLYRCHADCLPTGGELPGTSS